MAKEIIVAIIVSAGIPSAVIAFLSLRIQRKIDKTERSREKKEEAREEGQRLLLKSVFASISLGEAAATALKNGKTNGETERALSYAQEVKHEYRDFLDAQATKQIA